VTKRHWSIAGELKEFTNSLQTRSLWISCRRSASNALELAMQIHYKKQSKSQRHGAQNSW